MLRAIVLTMIACLALPAAKASAQRFDPAKVTAETFLFSDFIAQAFKEKSADGKKNPAWESMRETLLRLYPPGSDVEEFCKFFKRAAERDLNKSDSVEDQSSFRPRNGRPVNEKAVCGKARSGNFIAEYYFDLKFHARSSNPLLWVFPWGMGGTMTFRIPAQDGKISDILISVGYQN